MAQSGGPSPSSQFSAGLAGRPPLAAGLMLAAAAATFLLHAALSGRYGYFRDELYYLDLAHHLAPGYVDCAPLIAFYARLALLMGGSLPALRILPALASAGTVALAMYIAWQLGGEGFAQFFAGFCIFINPGRLMLDSLMTMNSFEPLFWMGCMAVLIRIIQTGNSRLWPWFGLLAGLGLENKHSTVFFGAAVVLALLLTEHRREFLKPWIWVAGAIALLLFLPNLVWQVRHHFPTLEDLENVRRTGKNVILSPPAFLLQQIMANHPLLLPVWLAGVVSFLRHRATRVLGYSFVVFFLIMMAMHAKDYYLFPMYPLVFAGGAVAFERWLNARPQPAARALRFAAPALLLLLTLPIFPLQLPILSPPRYVAYTAWLGFKQPKTETHHQSEWPQAFADQIGWEQLTGEVSGIFHALPPEEQAHAGIRASNYGEAGAIDFFGPRYGLPKAICAHQNHFLWGPPPQMPQTIIYLQSDPQMLKQNCASVEQAGVHYNRYGMGEENEPIYVCRGPRFDYRQTWPSLKHWN